ncbi:hypothetical protein MHO82_18145 [Vibrio sp. Of7-15]|uniref:hypothetical protein n=1 Tax=Vibrio sp. Of7-15 TaxID=2724879 RepID=UPI001EF2BE56|nr:hypothetical protein [Vibrio sp. Of7-15]MCG7498794.1 hypothetical protein [Vibrio sp. Of7-15]
MISPTQRALRARWAILFVVIVISVCFAQQAGQVSSCPITTSSSLISSFGFEHDVMPSPMVEEKCTLTDHMLNNHHFDLHDALLIMFSITLITVSGLNHIFYAIKLLPARAPPRRRHLTLCVFRE